jgi:tetratricopeptide (TPR) repeat protein
MKLPEEREAGRTVEAQVRTTDIMPSILEVLGVPAPASLDGESLGPLLAGTRAAPRTVFGETDYPLRFGWAPLRSVRKEGLKFIEAPKPELYDLQADPGEQRNKYAPWDGAVQKLRKILAELSAKSPAKASPATVSAGTIDELHALGYLGSADAGSPTDVPEPSFLPDPKDKIEEQNLLHTAMMASEDGKPDKARAALLKVLQLDERSVVALSQLGRLELSSGNYAKAALYLRRARDARPDDAAAALEYGRALELSGDLAGARDALQAGLKMNPNQFAARLSLGRVYLSLDDAKAAEDQLEAAVLLQPGSAEAQTGLAKALIRQKKFTDAVELLEPSAGSSSNDSAMFHLLSEAYAGLGRRQDAERAALRAKSLQESKRPQ